jgi:ATP-binding cassette, subfamily B, bacterial
MARGEGFRSVAPRFWAVAKRFVPYLRAERAVVAGSLLAMLGTVAARLLEPWPLKFVFDVLLIGGDAPLPFGLSPTELLLACAVALVAVIGARAGLQYLADVGFALVGQRVLTRVRARLFDHLQALPLTFHQRSRAGDLTLRLIGDVGLLKEVAGTALLPLLGNALVLLAMVIVMFVMHPGLAAVAVAGFPAFWWLSTREGKRIHGAAKKQRQREAAMAATANEALSAMDLVQAMSLQDAFRGRFAADNRRSLKEGAKIQRMSAGLERSVDVLIAVSTAVVVGWGARLAWQGVLTPGDLLVFMTYLKGAFRPMRDFAKYTARLSKAAAAGERVFAILDVEVARDGDGARSAAGIRGEVAFEGVRFGYGDGVSVLNGFDLVVPAGTTVALVGRSGAGKSTVASLLSRLHDPHEGVIRIDGVDVRDYQLASLRRCIGVVPQTSLLFDATIAENIGLGAGDVTSEQIRRAASLAQIDAFVAGLPDGYETRVAERGVSVSGGQRLRIAIARALVRETPIIVLDEPTAGLDEASVHAVTEALLALMRGRTAIVVTHDVSFAARADSIAVIDGGRVIEQGRHGDLLQAKGVYARMVSEWGVDRRRAEVA